MRNILKTLDYLEKNTYELDDAKANNFCNLLISIWGDEYNKRIREILSEIESNLLNPEFPIPEDDQGLKYFLGIEKITEEQKRIIRQELRDIAKKDSEAYI